MRLFRSILVTACATLIALVYVHQQVELVKLSYAIDYKEKCLKVMIDRREGVVYNINNLEDPARLERVLLAKKIDISFPKRRQVFAAAESVSRAKYKGSSRVVGFERKPSSAGILEFLGLKAEAQAKER